MQRWRIPTETYPEKLCCGLRLFRTWALHDKRQRYQEHHEQAKHPECVNEAQHVGLQVDLRRELRQGTVRGLSGAGAHGGEVLCHRVQLPLEEWIGMIGVRGEGGAVHLPLPGDEVIQQRYANRATHVARKAADARDLVEFVPWHPNIVERANGNEDERDSDDLNHAVGHNGGKADAEI
jgi:hypothetical protein